MIYICSVANGFCNDVIRTTGNNMDMVMMEGLIPMLKKGYVPFGRFVYSNDYGDLVVVVEITDKMLRNHRRKLGLDYQLN